MDTDMVIKIIVSIASGVGAVIPVLYQLIKYIKKAVEEKNWDQLVDLVMRYITEAEKKFKNGAERKEWVLAMVKATSDEIKVEVDYEKISELIDSLCEMSKEVNVRG